MKMGWFGDVQLFEKVLEPIFHGPAAQLSGSYGIGPRGDEKRSLGIVPERVDVHPGLHVRGGTDEPEPTHPGLADDDDDHTVFVELDVADFEVEDLRDSGPGVLQSLQTE